MTPDNLNEFSLFINQQMLSSESINEHLSKASALMQIFLHYDFSEFSQKTIHDYLWTLSDMIENAYTHNIKSLNDIFAAYKVVNCATSSQLTRK